MDFHHVGIATDDADGLADRYGAVLGAPTVHGERLDGLLVRFVSAGSGYLELLEPTDGGPVARFLEDRGPGIHHVALATPDLEAALSAARDAGAEPIDETPRPGAWGHDVAFLHPESMGGVLVELVGEPDAPEEAESADTPATDDA